MWPHEEFELRLPRDKLDTPASVSNCPLAFISVSQTCLKRFCKDKDKVHASRRLENRWRCAESRASLTARNTRAQLPKTLAGHKSQSGIRYFNLFIRAIARVSQLGLRSEEPALDLQVKTRELTLPSFSHTTWPQLHPPGCQ